VGVVRWRVGDIDVPFGVDTMNQPLLPPLAPNDDVIYWQAFYWACVNGRLYGGYMTRGAALVRMHKEQQSSALVDIDLTQTCAHMYWHLGGNCTRCGQKMPDHIHARFHDMINSDPQGKV